MCDRKGMLDEIINYVQSLQCQVEWLSMKLATVIPQMNFKLEDLPAKDKNVVSWTAMVVGYGQTGRAEEAVKMFHEMQRSGTEPEQNSLGQAISACANISSLEESSQFHEKARISGLILYVLSR
ncbi:hypothetical protein Bca52824_015451 [Brassica carinata]|uniref:Pentatricopeptide repeat-containing protein n=1 Tax=Brassica carinata TaxID=52824 RepID=A0A8X8B5D7_BRACI|nr:hypothetical protein Bca52824_015451 [Brassica carinata]